MTTTEDDPRKPKTTFDGEYPYIQAFQTLGGHTIIFDNTPGKETIRLSHGGNTNPGSYMEWSVNGKFVQVVRDNFFNYTKGGTTSTIDGATDTRVKSHERKSVSGGSHSEIAGKKSEAVQGGSTTITQGTQSSIIVSASPGGENDHYTAGDETSVHSGNKNSMVEGDVFNVINGNLIVQNKGENFETVQGGNKSSVIEGKYKLDAESDITIESQTKITLKVGESTITMTPSGIIIKSPRVDLNP